MIHVYAFKCNVVCHFISYGFPFSITIHLTHTVLTNFWLCSRIGIQSTCLLYAIKTTLDIPKFFLLLLDFGPSKISSYFCGQAKVNPVT